MGGKFHLKLNMGSRPIANKYHEGKMKRTLKRELKVPEIAEREANGTSDLGEIVVCSVIACCISVSVAASFDLDVRMLLALGVSVSLRARKRSSWCVRTEERALQTDSRLRSQRSCSVTLHQHSLRLGIGQHECLLSLVRDKMVSFDPS